MTGPAAGEDGQGAAEAALFAALRAAFPGGLPAGRVGVAVSGGGDSMAALHLAVRAFGPAMVEAVTVDHALRPEAAAEAHRVAEVCAGLGVAHQTRVWARDGAAGGNLQDRARRARYGLIAGWARTRGLAAVLLAHTADDQAETLLMGLARGAGIDGLAGMRRGWQAGGVTWLRPFLDMPRQALRDFLTGQGLGWCEDPSNADDRFQRVKARRALAALAPLGLTAARLATVAAHLAEARQALDRAADEAAARLVRPLAGAFVLGRQGFAALPPETARRLLIGLLHQVAGQPYPPRAAETARLMAAIAAGRDATLAGCRLCVQGDEALILREARAVAGLASPAGVPWDGRWQLTAPPGPAAAPGQEVRALGTAGLRLCPGWRATGLPRAVLAVSPAIWSGGRLIAAPVAGKAGDWQAECRPRAGLGQDRALKLAE